ncbi:nuclear transport factor 2 family protein [Mycobacterium yunnanensis]|uniref:Nuclear transport factor 2 family protein n=1 Tax=Mycobacterium yunnanensis TaxID=368477 RepID=A0A9X3BVB7_9MYCO|nr:nuclear transport factor 2 family protein [Mycobacterium yunnanensis]
MDDAARLLEIEAIKRLKARYCRHLDMKDWDRWRTVFVEDFVSDTSESGGTVIRGADHFVAYVRTTLGQPSQPTVHQVHAPEIDLVSATTANGVWALNDVVQLAPGLSLNGFGHYHETYEKADGEWRIASSRLTRLREDVVTPLVSIRVSERLRRLGATTARRLGRWGGVDRHPPSVLSRCSASGRVRVSTSIDPPSRWHVRDFTSTTPRKSRPG